MDETIAKAQKAFADAKDAFNAGIKSLTTNILESAALAQGYLKDAESVTKSLASESQAYADIGISEAKKAEELFFKSAKEGLEWSMANPMVAYPAISMGAVILFPPTRRLLYRMTFGRFTSPESVVKSSEARLEAMKTKVENCMSESQKLQEQMLKAEEEYKSGLYKLRSTRQELQRLSYSISSSESVTSGILKQLRRVPNKTDGVLALRGEAATQVSTLRSQKTKVNKFIRRIANKDI